jgi:hypothetical protein
MLGDQLTVKEMMKARHGAVVVEVRRSEGRGHQGAVRGVPDGVLRALEPAGPATAGSCHCLSGSRPMKPSSRVCTSESAGTSTLGPYWPLLRRGASICSIPASS